MMTVWLRSTEHSISTPGLVRRPDCLREGNLYMPALDPFLPPQALGVLSERAHGEASKEFSFASAGEFTAYVVDGVPFAPHLVLRRVQTSALSTQRFFPQRLTCWPPSEAGSCVQTDTMRILRCSAAQELAAHLQSKHPELLSSASDRVTRLLELWKSPSSEE